MDRNGSAILFVSQRRIVAKSRASLTSAEVKHFRATVSVTNADAMVGGLQVVRKGLGFKVSSREF